MALVRCALFCAMSVYVVDANEVNGYVWMRKTYLRWAPPLQRAVTCGYNESKVCDPSELAGACDAVASCTAFDSNGYLYSCPGGRCDCDSGPAFCLRGLDIYNASALKDGSLESVTDVWVSAGSSSPPEWLPFIANASYLYGSPEAAECYMPEVGNGYLATSIGWGALYVGGLYNGACGSVRKARFPSPVAITLGAQVTGGALDTQAGMYRRRLVSLSDAGASIRVEQRWYAHRTRRNVLVMEVSPLDPLPEGDTLRIDILQNLWAPTPNGAVPPSGSIPGAGCAGGFDTDFAFPVITTYGAAQATLIAGNTTIAGDEAEIFNVTLITEQPQGGSIVWQGSGGQQPPAPATYVTVVTTSLDLMARGGDGDSISVMALAQAQYDAARAAGGAQLLAEHTAAWAVLNQAGIDVTAASTDPADMAMAASVAAHARSSYYYLLASIREDWHVGVSPGGIASGSYQGAVFMDQDWWMLPGLTLLAPSLAASVLQYRADALASTGAHLATLFGYNGTMAAWTAAYKGRPFGCCSGHGAYEDCLEQHVTGDIAWSAWQYYAASGNRSWLAGTGWPMLQGIADFHLSRVAPTPDGNYTVNGVLPIDEWCVGSGCGCETPGVNDDAQMNGVTRAALLKAAQAAGVLDNVAARSQLWQSVGSRVWPLFNATHGHHDQFTSPTCPDGWGGSHYSGRATVCPEDVMLLSYPLGDFLGVSPATTAADAAVFMSLTCKENAGMTTPMHVIVYTSLGPAYAQQAQAELNRSMHAAAYGPFNVRNEVDKHADITGAHYDNSHFLTGDGGFLQGLMNGYGGLRITDGGLRILAPAGLPQGVGQMVLRQVQWHARVLTLTYTADSVTVGLASSSAGMGVLSATNACAPLAPGGSAALPVSTFAWPALLVEGC